MYQMLRLTIVVMAVVFANLPTNAPARVAVTQIKLTEKHVEGFIAADMDMGGMDMTGFRMIPAGIGIMAPTNAPWKAIEFAFVFAMWAVMMVGMMAPSAAPMILMYARVGRQAKSAGKPLAATGWFAAGYFPAINQKVALRLLERLGYRADVVGDGRQALARLDHAAYDVILMDVQMPEMDGLEASRAICARWAASKRPRIIAMTAEAMQGDRDKCLAAGMDDYIVKPVTLDQLAAALAKFRPLAAATAPEAAAAPPVEKQRIAAGTALDRDVLDQLREDLGGTAALREVIRSFLDQTPSVLSALRDAAARADVPSIRRVAHMIKGTSSILGARELSEQCAEIERVGQTGCIADAGSRVIAVEASYRTIEAALKAEIERLRP